MSTPMALPTPTLTEDGERIVLAGVEMTTVEVYHLCDRLHALRDKANDRIARRANAERHAAQRADWIKRHPVHGPLTEDAGGGLAHVRDDGRIDTHKDRASYWGTHLRDIVSYPVVVAVRAPGARTVHLWRGGPKLLCGADAPMVLGDPRTCSRECAACTAVR